MYNFKKSLFKIIKKVTFIFGITTDKMKHAENSRKAELSASFCQNEAVLYHLLCSVITFIVQGKNHLASVSFTCSSIPSPTSLDSKIYSWEYRLNCNAMFSTVLIVQQGKTQLVVFTVLFPGYPFLNQVV